MLGCLVTAPCSACVLPRPALPFPTTGGHEQAVAVQSKQPAGKKKTMASWADSDTESDVDNAAPPPRKLDAFGESESDSESESEEEEESEVCVFVCVCFLH